jgi:hypothetical protein
MSLFDALFGFQRIPQTYENLRNISDEERKERHLRFYGPKQDVPCSTEQTNPDTIGENTVKSPQALPKNG